MASSSIHHTLCPLTKHFKAKPTHKAPTHVTFSTTTLRRISVAVAAFQDQDLLPVKSTDRTDQPVMIMNIREEADVINGSGVGGGGGGGGAVVNGFDGQQLSLEGVSGGGGGGGDRGNDGGNDIEKLIDRGINVSFVLAAGTFAITKLLTIDHDYWHGWTVYEILRYAPQHNWNAYEEILKTHPLIVKMVISGVVYSIGDLIAQCYEGKPLYDFDRARMLRSGLTGFALHGSMSHYYYDFCEAVFPVKSWWTIPLKAGFDQTVWTGIWNCIYFTALGLMRFESPTTIYKELKATFWPLLRAGWKLWPFAHIVTYGVIPVEQRLLWVDCVELIWVTILSTYSNEKSEARISEAAHATTSNPSQE